MPCAATAVAGEAGDEQPTRKRQARTVVVGNVGRLQGGVDFLPDALPDSGQFDVAILAPRTPHPAPWAAGSP